LKCYHQNNFDQFLVLSFLKSAASAKTEKNCVRTVVCQLLAGVSSK